MTRSRMLLENLAALAIMLCALAMMAAVAGWSEYERCGRTWGDTSLQWRWRLDGGCQVLTPQGWAPSMVVLIREGR